MVLESEKDPILVI